MLKGNCCGGCPLTLLMFVLFTLTRKILLIEPTRIEFCTPSAAIRAHRLKSSHKLGALRFDLAHYLLHHRAGLGCCLHTKTSACHKHKLLRVYVHHVRNRGVLRRFSSVVVILTVVSLALHKVRNTDKVAAEMDRDVIGNIHLYAEIKGTYGAMLGEEKLVSPFGSGELGACFSYCIKRAKLGQHPVLLGGIFQKLNREIHSVISFRLFYLNSFYHIFQSKSRDYFLIRRFFA